MLRSTRRRASARRASASGASGTSITNPMAAPAPAAPAPAAPTTPAPAAPTTPAPAPPAPAPPAPAPAAPASAPAASAPAAPVTPSAASNTLFLNIEGDEYTRKKELKENYGPLTEDQINKLSELYAKDGTFNNTVDLTVNDKKFIVDAFEKRIKGINAQLENTGRNILIFQPLRTVKTKLQDRLVGIKGTTAVASVSTKPPILNEATRKKLDDRLMTLLLRIGYAITHSKQIPPSFIEKWNNFLKSTDELTKEAGGEPALLNITENALEQKTLTIDKTSFVKPLGKKPIYKNVTDYLKDMTAVSDREVTFKTQIGDTLEALYTYQFIQESERNAFKNKNTKRIEKMSSAVKNRIRIRFSSSMAIILQYYKTLLGQTDVYDTINTVTFLNIFIPPPLRPTTAPSPYFPVQEGLRMIEGILDKVYSKLSETTTLGIYKINSDDSAKLIPLLNFYRETTRGQSLSDKTMKEQFKAQPFVWFQLGADIVKPSSIVVDINKLTASGPTTTTTTASIDNATLAETFNNFIGVDDKMKAPYVFMMVNSTYPVDATPSTFALLHTFGEDSEFEKEASAIAAWNDKFITLSGSGSGFRIPSLPGLAGFPTGPPRTVEPPRLSDIGMIQWPPYTLQTHLSMPVFQCMTFLAAANQISSANKQYKNLVLPP